ncbi:glycosyltransferase family 1 protein [Klenkia sp. PcliD-1-E]|uniref:glycosyltransferase family 4 protein n=1 Tax=Klenkia sp. PcliD-1-E TaxID=2954492 RepID=UPI002097823E|nr:glycosyltransferase family 1 protein [Klenkia sp. PcliD-1-E]MCO7220216.1 glycosyltransferase family 4 protein [Klenkia sp. PcliD-1-E]
MTRPLRWLLMAGHVPGNARGGGIVRYTVELARALRRRPDVELHLLVDPAAAVGLTDLAGDRDRLLELPPLPGPAVPAYERTALGLRLRGRYDVVQGVKHLLPRGLGRTHGVLTVHDMLLMDRPQDFGTAKRTLLQLPYAGSIRGADTLVCVSAATRARLSAFDPRTAARSTAVPLATSPTLLTAEPRPVEGLGDRPFALVVGDTQPRKNLPTVVTAWRQVVARRPDAVLVQVGPPPWGEESYGPDFAPLVASGHLRQLQGVDDGTLRWAYEQAAVVLAPSLAEGFGLPAAEALDLGAPLVTSTDAALVEVSGDRARHLPAEDVDGWAAAVLEQLAAPRPTAPAPAGRRTWDDVAEGTVAAVRRGQAGRTPST